GRTGSAAATPPATATSGMTRPSTRTTWAGCTRPVRRSSSPTAPSARSSTPTPTAAWVAATTPSSRPPGLSTGPSPSTSASESFGARRTAAPAHRRGRVVSGPCDSHRRRRSSSGSTLPETAPPHRGTGNATRVRSSTSVSEPGGTRTLDRVIKSHVLYHLSYRLLSCIVGAGRPRVHRKTAPGRREAAGGTGDALGTPVAPLLGPTEASGGPSPVGGHPAS